MDFTYKTPGVNSQEVLQQAQLISDIFAKAMQQHNCTMVVPISLHQSINQSYNNLLTLAESATTANNAMLNPTRNPFAPNSGGISDQAANIAAAKSACFNCKLGLPSISVKYNFDFSIGSLRGQLDAFINLFKIEKPNLCQAAFAMQSSCIPDIIRLISLLLTAYMALLAAQKLSKISLCAFINGIISAILGQVFAAISVTVNVSSINIACIINAFEEIVNALPRQSDFEGFETPPNPKLMSAYGKIAQVDNTLHAIDNGLNAGAQLANTMIQEELDEVFTLVSDTLTEAVKGIETYIINLLGLQDFMECESKRSGMDFTEDLQTIRNFMNVINMLSALALSLASKQIREKFCKSDKNINKIGNTDITNTQIADYLGDYYESTAVLTGSDPNDITVLLYETPNAPIGLPKLDFYTCNLNEFIQAHTLDNILATAVKKVEAEDSVKTFTDPWMTYNFNTPSDANLNNIKGILDLIYDNPIDIPDNSKTSVDLKSYFGYNSDNSQKSIPTACRSAEDILNILNQFGR